MAHDELDRLALKEAGEDLVESDVLFDESFHVGVGSAGLWTRLPPVDALREARGQRAEVEGKSRGLRRQLTSRVRQWT